MKFQIKHEIKGRIRIHAAQKRMTFAQADTLQYYLTGYDFVQNVKIRERTCDITISFSGDREDVIHVLRRFSYERIEAPEVIRRLKQYGISKVVMMTGDSDRIASTIADKVGVDEYYSEVLPEDKAKFVEKEKNAGRKVIMIGDGINDSPALSEASVGIAISDGAEIAREIADVTISADDLYEIATLKQLSDAMVRRINKNYRLIVGINTGLIALGIAGIFQPTMSALFHNTSTILISLKSMNDLLDREEMQTIQ